MLKMIQHLFTSYEGIYEIDLKGNAVKMMGPYDPTENLAQLIEQLKKVRELVRAGGNTIFNSIMVSKGISLLVQIATSKKDI